ncbi:MAG: hypothetical protein GXP33_07045 [Spirochaetes bacterium]|nr:hypothetical protein [Spirochaetota bacterium]
MKDNRKSARVRNIDLKSIYAETGGHGISERVISGILERVPETYRIGEVSWARYPYRPDAVFKIAGTDDGLVLRYKVSEDSIRAVNNKTNEPVYEDSCVEFFFSEDGKHYYNFEFNCIGTALIGYGSSRENREWIEPELIEKILRFPSLGREPFTEKKGSVTWQLSVYIPFTFFKKMHLAKKYISERDLSAAGGDAGHFRANFYKCGDKLSTPHFVSWNRILTEKPDFHRPDYFGDLIFE